MLDMREALKPYVVQLAALPFVRAVDVCADKGPAHRSHADGVLRIHTVAGTHEEVAFAVTRSHLGRDQAQHLIGLAASGGAQLVVAPAIGRELGAVFEKAGVQFIDLAGNCFIRLGDHFVARVQGNTAPPLARGDKGLRAPAYRVLFALLAQPSLAKASARALAHASGGVSPQTANDLRQRLLERQQLLAVGRTHRWAPTAHRHLMEQWLAGASATLYPSLLLGRFRAPERDPESLEARLAPLLERLGRWAWGGGAAAHRLTEFYRGESTVVYLQNVPSGVLARELGAIADARGSLRIMHAPGPLAFSPGSPTIHPLLAYTDLLQEESERAHEAARELAERYLGDEHWT